MGMDRNRTDDDRAHDEREAAPALRLTRRHLAGGALGLGLSASALGAATNRLPSALAFQDATPVDMGIEELDLANLSPDIPDPTEQVTITFQSWYDTSEPYITELTDAFHQLHPNIRIEYVAVPAEEATNALTRQVAGG